MVCGLIPLVGLLIFCIFTGTIPYGGHGRQGGFLYRSEHPRAFWVFIGFLIAITTVFVWVQLHPHR
jgi:hypothetical protein